MTSHIILNENSYAEGSTGAGLMRNRCAFTSRDQAADWASAFTYQIVFGWDDNEHPEEGSMDELAEMYGWDAELIAWLRKAHESFAKLTDRAVAA